MARLPGLLGDIADIAGAQTAFEVAQARGGTRVSIPPRAAENHWLTDAVGFETADRICRGLATLGPDGELRGIHGELLPLGPAAVLRNARRVAAAALDEGQTASGAALASGLHERTVWRMKAKQKSDDDQGNLF